MVQKVQEHYTSAPSAIVQRFKFYSCNRQTIESIASYVARLRGLTQHCEFGDNLDTMLRDRLVCGVNNEQPYSVGYYPSDMAKYRGRIF